jgi:hypothetical protein
MKKKPLFEIIPDSIVKSGSNGYLVCQTKPIHPHSMVLSDRKARYIYVHIVVYENSIGHVLDKRQEGEIHHKDNDPTNNKLSNLELKKKGEHQRDHALKDNHFWKKSPLNKPKSKKKAAQDVAAQFIQHLLS